MKQITAISAFAFVLSAGLSVAIFAGVQSTDTPRSSDSCEWSQKDETSSVAYEAKDGEKCDKKKKECDRKTTSSTSNSSGKEQCELKKKKQKASSRRECEGSDKKKTAASVPGS